MRRDLAAIGSKHYDVIVVGGGIFGICTAWDAALRGLSVAILERGDFAHATSGSCFRIVHGGFRYLQHLDIARIRESSRERTALLRIAPHLVRPLPIVVPTYGHGRRGRIILGAALSVYDMITFDRNFGIKDPERRVPAGHMISRRECLQMFPALRGERLTGGVIFYDGQMYSAARLALSYLRSAVKAGADAANYVEVTGFCRRGDRVLGVEVRDTLAGTMLEARGAVVVNAAGPWAERVLAHGLGIRLRRTLYYSRDACFWIRRQLSPEYALAIQGCTKDPDAILSRGPRHLFIAPWGGGSLVGVWHSVYRGEPDGVSVSRGEIEAFIQEVNEGYPALELTPGDVSMCNAGLVLFGENAEGQTDLSYGKRSIIVDHAREHGLDGLLTVIGVRYTTARAVAEEIVNRVYGKLERRAPRSRTAVTPIYGGEIPRMEKFERETMRRLGQDLPPEVAAGLISTYGSEYPEVVRYYVEDPAWADALDGSRVIKAQVLQAVRREMAQKLGDVVFRRTELGVGGHPGGAALAACGRIVARELGWDRGRLERELEDVASAFRGVGGTASA